MSREVFGPLGALASEADFARALAAIGAFYPETDAGAALVARALDADGGIAQRITSEHGNIFEVPVRIAALAAYARAQREFAASHGGPLPWTRALAQWQELSRAANHLRLRIEQAPPGTPDADAIDPAWLARLLGSPALDVFGVFVEQTTDRPGLTWDWPLRVGVGRERDGLVAALRASRFANLFNVNEVTAADRCDLLLLPMGLAEALRGDVARASAVVVMGGSEATSARTSTMLARLGDRCSAAAVALAYVPVVAQPAWFDALVAELAHNATLDVALLRAARGAVRTRYSREDKPRMAGDLTPPLLRADRAFLDEAVIVETARRLGAAIARMPKGNLTIAFDRSFSGLALPGAANVPVRNVGGELQRHADRLRWDQETGDATVLADVRQRVESATGAPLTLPPLAPWRGPAGADAFDGMLDRHPAAAAPAAASPAAPTRTMRAGTRAAPPPRAPAAAAPVSAPAPEPAPAPPPAPEARSVLVTTQVLRPDGQWETSTLAVGAGESCALDTWIGLPRAAALHAGKALDEKSLPPSATGHTLTLVFTPLWRDGAPPAQTARVHLPLFGDSEHATFYFNAPSDLSQLRARLVVLFGLRVLQTLMLDVVMPPADKARAALRLSPENVVSHDFGERTQAPAFEGALIANDNPAGTPGITGVTGDGAAFIEPVGLDEMVEQIRKELAVLNQGEDTPDDVVQGLDDPRVDTLLRNLAARGAWFTRQLRSQPPFAPLLGATRLQVVDARRGAYLPVEFFYDGKAPLPSATRCPNAVAALEDASVHTTCANAKDANFHCPAAFWGFSRCIERQPVGGQGTTIFRQPQPGANTLRPLAKALLAASRRVRAQDLDPPAGIEAVLGRTASGVVRAQSWTEWQQKIASESPSLLVMLPHSLDSPDFPGIPALEINGTNLASVNLDRDYVTAAASGAPMVLLLGCSTALPRIPFLNFVGEFKDNGAAVVIGTIALIRGRQTGAFVGALLAELRAATATGGTFDEVLLRVKRKLLAAGDPFVLSLMAYGDTGWRIEA